VISHHASEVTLLSYAAGTLPEALALVLATHLTHCAECRQTAAKLEAIGGALLDVEPVPLPEAALDQVLARLDDPPLPVPPILNPALPTPLNRIPLGRWWPFGLGLWWRPLQVSGAAWGGLILAQPGRALPPHGHAGLELTTVLSGAFSDNGRLYVAGDLTEPETDHDHPLKVVGDEPCLCVLASEGMHLRGLLGRAQRLIGL
jgi:putative transcriptional regulator